MNDVTERSKLWSDMSKRALSSLVFATLVLTAVYVGGWAYFALLLVGAALCLKEWLALKTPRDHLVIWLVIGTVYLAVGFGALALLRQAGNGGFWSALYIILVVWAVDIGGYLFGRLIGGPKLAPRISPKKTWAGLLGGMLCAGIISVAMLYAVAEPDPSYSILLPLAFAFLCGAILAVIEQAGDLFESWIKRRAGVKDSGALMPGHGGLLDRIDGLLFAAPAWGAILWIIEV